MICINKFQDIVHNWTLKILAVKYIWDLILSQDFALSWVHLAHLMLRENLGKALDTYKLMLGFSDLEIETAAG